MYIFYLKDITNIDKITFEFEKTQHTDIDKITFEFVKTHLGLRYYRINFLEGKEVLHYI